MPQRYQELRKNFNEVITKVFQCNSKTDKRDIERFLLSITLRIWACNTYYAKEYKEAIHAIQEKPYTMEQIVTAMACCGEQNRELCTPTFLDEIKSQATKRDIIWFLQAIRERSWFFIGNRITNMMSGRLLFTMETMIGWDM